MIIKQQVSVLVGAGSIGRLLIKGSFWRALEPPTQSAGEHVSVMKGKEQIGNGKKNQSGVRYHVAFRLSNS
jgi:hypothetical protein